MSDSFQIDRRKRVVFGFFLWLLPISLSIQLVILLVTNAEWPGNGFLHHPNERLADLLNPIKSILLIDPYAGSDVFFNPPALVLLLKVVSWPGQWFAVITLGIAFIGLIHKFSILLSTPKSMSLILVSVLGVSYPILFAFDRGSYTLWIAFLLVLTVSSNQEHPHRAAFYLGVVISLGYAMAPLFLLLILRYETTFLLWVKQGAVLLATATLTTSIGLLDLRMSPMHVLRGIQSNLAEYNQMMLHSEWGALYSHSLFNGVRSSCALIKTIGNYPIGIDPLENMQTCPDSIQALIPLSWIVLLLVMIVVTLSRAHFFYRSLLLVSSFLFFTPISADYRLCFLIIPILFLRSSISVMRIPVLPICFVSFLFIPRTINVFVMPRFSETAILFSNISGSLAMFVLVLIGFVESVRSFTLKPWQPIKSSIVLDSLKPNSVQTSTSFFLVYLVLPTLNFAVLLVPITDPALSIFRLSYFLAVTLLIILYFTKSHFFQSYFKT